MWDPLLAPGLRLLTGLRGHARHFAQEVAHYALHADSRVVLWCDGDHGFNPYHFAELNITRGHQADEGADRLLVKRCMTAFQWDTVLDKQLAEKLRDTPTSLVIAAPYDGLFRHQELQDWEQEDYLAYSLRHLRDLATAHRVPILAFVDLDRLWHTHPSLAGLIVDAIRPPERWAIQCPDGRWRLTHEATGTVLDPYLRRRTTLLDFLEEPAVPVPTVLPPRPPRRLKTPVTTTRTP